MTVAVPGRSQAIAICTNLIIPSLLFHARQLSSRVATIWTTHEHGTSANLHTDAAIVARHVFNAYVDFEAHGNNTLWAVRAVRSGPVKNYC